MMNLSVVNVVVTSIGVVIRVLISRTGESGSPSSAVRSASRFAY